MPSWGSAVPVGRPAFISLRRGVLFVSQAELGSKRRRSSELGEEGAFEGVAGLETEVAGDAVGVILVGGGAVDKDDDVGDAVLVGEIGGGHVGAASVVEGAIPGLEGEGDAGFPLEFGPHREEASGVLEVLGGEVGAGVGAGDEGHAAALHGHIDEGDPGGDGIGGILMRPVGLVLMELGGCVIPGFLDEDLVVPEAEGGTGEPGCDGGEIGMEGKLLEGVVFLPGVDELIEDGAAAGLGPLAEFALLEVEGGGGEACGLLGGNDSRDVDETVGAVFPDLRVGEGFGGGHGEGRREMEEGRRGKEPAFALGFGVVLLFLAKRSLEKNGRMEIVECGLEKRIGKDKIFGMGF